ncbi:MAG: glycosyltransferase family 2 protein [Nocardioidaceae bacterium]|nr:glycosyltransferase family 2 protein [Nocardioidaceae bacterium]MCL2612333.1 glycosyltransferase family 2 protein [Nocardioidaceae bacterium]
MVIRSQYFEPRDIQLDDDDIVVLSCIRNEAARLPYFLEYYRSRGVKRFLCVDNGSTDETGEILAAQPDVEVFTTTGSYRGSAAGRLWLQELGDTYAVGHWTLTVDVDELLVYPASERVPLKALCRYLDRRGVEGLFTVMLDMYSDRTFADTNYVPGSPFLDTCSFFETDSYSLRPEPNPPFLSIFGGPRGRLYARSTPDDPGPMMKKVPLVKWMPGFSYIRSTHTHRHVPLADITGALLHFKFFGSFEKTMRTEYLRGDRRQNHVYARYVEEIGPDTSFMLPTSHQYDGPRDLVARGVMTSHRTWRSFCENFASRWKRPFDVDALLPDPPASPQGLETLASTWPFANNRGMHKHFGIEMPGRRDTRAALLEEIRRWVDVVEIGADRVLLRIGEQALHRWQPHGLAVVLTVGGRVAGSVPVDGTDDDVLRIVTDSLEPNVCAWPVDVAGLLGDASYAEVAVHLVDAQDPDRPLPAAGATWTPGPRDAELLACTWHRSPVPAGEMDGTSGRIERLEDGSIVGWARDEQGRDLRVNVYVDGRLAVHTDPPRAYDPSGFSVPLPIGYFADHGATELVVDVRTAGTNVVLERSPLRFPVTSRDAEWRDDGWRPVR